MNILNKFISATAGYLHDNFTFPPSAAVTFAKTYFAFYTLSNNKPTVIRTILFSLRLERRNMGNRKCSLSYVTLKGQTITSNGTA